MGVDVTLMVLAPYSDKRCGFVTTVISLNRDRDLWDELVEVEKAYANTVWPNIQLPRSAWCNFSGERPKGEEWKDRECGHLQEDNYGGSFKSFKGHHLMGKKSTYQDLNTAALAFIAEHYPHNDVIIFWH